MVTFELIFLNTIQLLLLSTSSLRSISFQQWLFKYNNYFIIIMIIINNFLNR